MAIDYFEGLGTDPRELDPDRVAPAGELRRLAGELLDLGEEMSVVSLSTELRRQLGITALPEATELISACADFAAKAPEIAAAAGDTAAEWTTVSEATHAYQGACKAIAPVLRQTRANEAVLLHALTGAVAAARSAGEELLADPATSGADRDILRVRLASVSAPDTPASATGASQGVPAQAASAADVAHLDAGIARVFESGRTRKGG